MAPRKRICMIIGDPVWGSLSPAMHNAAYQDLGIADEYNFLAKRIIPSALESEVASFRSPQIAGVSVTMPHKESIMNFLDELDETARAAGAVNTLVNRAGKLIGYNTDWQGVTGPLREKMSLRGKHAALFGAGGAARAAAFGLTREGAEVTLFNRTAEKAQAIAAQFNCTALPPEKISAAYDIFINATPLGMEKLKGESPLPADVLSSRSVVFEMVYQPPETKLIRDARAAGAEVIPGREMLLHQGAAQFELYTGRKAPLEAMRAALDAASKIE